jgi:hypothetical protein
MASYIFDAFYDSITNMIVCVGTTISAAGYPSFWLIDCNTLYLYPTAAINRFGTNSTQMSSVSPVVLNLGDGSFFTVYGSTTPVNTYTAVVKWTPTAILGVARVSAALNGTLDVIVGAGIYPTNTIFGSSGQPFDMVTNGQVTGNKGTLSNSAISLRGIQ